MSTTVALSLLLMLVLLVVCGVCAAAETALFSLSYHDRLKLKRLSPAASRAVGSLLQRPRELLVSLLFINLMASTIYMVLTTIVVMDLTSAIAIVAVSAFNLLLHTVIAEVVSKMLAARRRVDYCRFFSLPILTVFRAMGPLRTFLDRGLVAPLARLFLGPGDRLTAMTADDLSLLLTHAAKDGAIDSDEQRVLRKVVQLNGLRVREVMTPRMDMDWIDESATHDEVIHMARERARTRVPVWRSSDENMVLGMLDVKKYLVQAARGSRPRILDCLEPVRYVPDTGTLDRLLEEMRARGFKNALCVDEHGAVTGLIAAEDVVKRLINEIVTDDDGIEETGEVKLVGLGEWSVPGRLPARDWAMMFGLPPDPRVATLSGLVFARLGRLPRVGDAVHLGNVRLRVEALDGRMVDRVLVSVGEPEGTPVAGRAASPPIAAGPAGKGS